MRFVAIDFETTGTVGGFVNEPWQLGLVAFADGRVEPATKREFFFRVDAARPFSRRAPGRWASIRDELAAAPTFAEQWAELAGCLVGAPLAAHNVATERTLLTRLAPLTAFGPWLDTLTMARTIYPKLASHALGDLCATFGLVREVEELCPGRTWHDALFDACAGAVLGCHFSRLVDLRGFWRRG